MEESKKAGRYERISRQLEDLLVKTGEPISRMASICALLHHKMDHFFWTGFYFLEKEKMFVGPYQGPVACQELESHKGVCWAAADRGEAVIVDDVHSFPGHIGCDSRSQSELTLPVRDQKGRIVAVFDVDSDQPAAFSDVDRNYLEEIIKMIYA